jgi:hypothetical protein
MAATVMAGKSHMNLLLFQMLSHKANFLSQAMEAAATSRVAATPVAVATSKVEAMVEVRVSSAIIPRISIR